MSAKYELTDETRELMGSTLYRIKALRGFGDVKAGDLGGWVQSTKNLSQTGPCWVYDEAAVVDGAHVTGSATLHDQATVGGSALLFGVIHLRGDTTVFGGIRLFGEFDCLSGMFT